MITWEKIQFTGFKIFWISVGHHFGCYHDDDGHDDGDHDDDHHILILAHLSPSSLPGFPCDKAGWQGQQAEGPGPTHPGSEQTRILQLFDLHTTPKGIPPASFPADPVCWLLIS